MLETLTHTQLQTVAREFWKSNAGEPRLRQLMLNLLLRSHPEKPSEKWNRSAVLELERLRLQQLLTACWDEYFTNQLLPDFLNGDFERVDAAVAQLSPELARLVRRCPWPGCPADRLAEAVVYLVTSDGELRAATPYKPFTADRLVELRGQVLRLHKPDATIPAAAKQQDRFRALTNVIKEIVAFAESASHA